MSEQRYRYARDLLALNTFANKQISEMTGLGKNVVKEVDLRWLKDRYTLNGKRIKPENKTKFLGILVKTLKQRSDVTWNGGKSTTLAWRW